MTEPFTSNPRSNPDIPENSLKFQQVRDNANCLDGDGNKSVQGDSNSSILGKGNHQSIGDLTAQRDLNIHSSIINLNNQNHAKNGDSQISIAELQVTTTKKGHKKIKIDVDFSYIDDVKTKRIEILLREKTGDMNFKITDVKKGSIEIYVEASPEALELLQSLIESGELTEELSEILGVTLKDSQIIAEDSSASQNQELEKVLPSLKNSWDISSSRQIANLVTQVLPPENLVVSNSEDYIHSRIATLPASKTQPTSKAQFPTLLHPDRHVWDFWHYFDPENKIFHLFYLNADRESVLEDKHHFCSQVGYATTKDFMTIEWISDLVLGADPHGWDNTSIWMGDVIKINGGFLMFYTSRNHDTDDGLTQNIGIAFTHHVNSFDRWFRIPNIRIQPQDPYEQHHVPGNLTIHAWRDPFLFHHKEQIYMLLAAKDPNQPLGKKGTVALLRAQNNSFEHWEYLPPIYHPGYYSEIEVPQLYRAHNNDYVLLYNSWAKYDFAPSTAQSGGLQGTRSNCFFNFPDREPQVYLPETSNLYACRVIPELGGEIVGVDTITGGIRRSGVKTRLQHVNRDFSSYSIDL